MSVNTKVNGQLVPSAGLYKVKVPIQSGDIYSTQERQVGVWTDGKPLYQKTIIGTTITGQTSDSHAHGISNIDEIIDADVNCHFSANDYWRKLNFTCSIGETQSAWNAGFAVDTTNIIFQVGNSFAGGVDKWYATIKYTKTTDVAGSGEYVPSGDKAVHYSENEEVIGTWIDGSTLYRKTVNVGSFPNCTHKEIAHGITNLGIVLRMYGYAKSTTTSLILPYITVEHGMYQIALEITDTNVVIWTDYDRSAFSGYVVLEYTKSSS